MKKIEKDAQTSSSTGRRLVPYACQTRCFSASSLFNIEKRSLYDNLCLKTKSNSSVGLNVGRPKMSLSRIDKQSLA